MRQEPLSGRLNHSLTKDAMHQEPLSGRLNHSLTKDAMRQEVAMHSRRVFIKRSGLALVSLGLEPTFFRRIAAAETGGKGKILIAIFQRGAADGLNIVVPFAEKTYYELRPTIAIPAPSAGDDK